MGAHGSSYKRFRRAIDAGQSTLAYVAAAELERLTLADALDLVRVLAQDGHPRFNSAALRWLARFAAERARTIHEVVIAAGALLELPVSERARRMLRDLIRD